jgi:AraC-like DNA-binding protein
MLTETDEPIAQIAPACGFSHQEHFSASGNLSSDHPVRSRNDDFIGSYFSTT